MHFIGAVINPYYDTVYLKLIVIKLLDTCIVT